MTYENQLDAAIQDKEEYLKYLDEVQIVLERSIERDLIFYFSNTFMFWLFKVVAISILIAMVCGMGYAYYKFFGPGPIQHILSLMPFFSTMQ